MSSSQLEKIGTITKPLIGAAHKVEGALGMFFGTFLTLLLAGLVGMNYESWKGLRDGERALWAAGALASLFLDVPYLIRLWRVAIRRPAPINLEAAALQRASSMTFRPAN